MARMQKLIANLTGGVRTETVGGKEYTIAPVVMMVTGVHNGTNGPLYYPTEEMSQLPVVWNSKPVVVNHPQKDDGTPCSACDPSVLEKSGIGVLYNTSFEEGKWKAEAWLDMDRVNAVDSRIADAVNNGTMMELSTGLFTDNEEVEGEWEGEAYSAIARNYRPDHLAILPDAVGACSILDGAGFIRNQQATDTAKEGRVVYSRDETGRLSCSILTDNEKSHDKLRDDLSELLREKFNSGTDATSPWAWVEAVFDDFFIYDYDGKLYRQDYTSTDQETVLTGEAEEVYRVVEYRTMHGDFIGNTSNNTRSNQMDKQKMIQGLIDNEATQWTEEDHTILDNMAEDVLAKLVPNEKVAETPVKTPVEIPAPAPATNRTVAEYIADAPAEIREALQEGMTANQQQRQSLIATITANTANTFTPEQLAVMSVNDLRAVAKLAADPNASTVPNYAGQGDSPIGNAGGEEALPLTEGFGE